jgi:hypothetical protein
MAMTIFMSFNPRLGPVLLKAGSGGHGTLVRAHSRAEAPHNRRIKRRASSIEMLQVYDFAALFSSAVARGRSHSECEHKIEAGKIKK